MAEWSERGQIPENPLVAKLLASGAEAAFSGYVGPLTGEDIITLYPRLGDLSLSVEIARSDILHFETVPQTPFGRVILWVKKDAQVTRRSATSVDKIDAARAKPIELRRGRLLMRLGSRRARG